MRPISSIIGCSFALKFIVENSRNRTDKKIRLRQSSIINDQHFTTWHTINWMGKVFLVTGIWFITGPLHFEISFYDDFLLFLLLLPVVWYISLWSTFIRLFGAKSYRWIGIATAVIVLNSFLLTRLDVVDTAKINEKLIQTTIDYNYEVNVPESTSPTRLGFPNIPIDFYVGFKKHSSGDSPSLIPT